MAAREQALRNLEIESGFDLAERDYPELAEAIGQQAVRGAAHEATVYQLPTDYQPVEETDPVQSDMEDSDFTESDIEAAAQLERSIDPLRAIRIRTEVYRMRHRGKARSEEQIMRDTTSDGQADKAANHTLLTPAEEIFLAKRIERGDLEAKQMLIDNNIKLLMNVSRKHFGSVLEFDDNTNNGMIGLIRATEKFDWRKGFRFSTYATLWIKQAMQRETDNTERAIRLPANIAQLARKKNRFERDFIQKSYGESPTPEIIADFMNISVEHVNRLTFYETRLRSLHETVGEDDTMLEDFIADSAPPIEEQIIESDEVRQLRAALDQLSPRNAAVLRLALELGSSDTKNVTALAKRLELTPKAASEAYTRAFNELQAQMLGAA